MQPYTRHKYKLILKEMAFYLPKIILKFEKIVDHRWF